MHIIAVMLMTEAFRMISNAVVVIVVRRYVRVIK